MGCLFSKFREHETINSNELITNSKTIALRKIPKMLYFKDIIPTELNFEVKQSSDDSYRVTIGYKEYESIFKYEHILVPYDEIPEIDIESQFPSIYERRESLQSLEVSGLQY